jgi:hypothetical protein
MLSGSCEIRAVNHRTRHEMRGNNGKVAHVNTRNDLLLNLKKVVIQIYSERTASRGKLAHQQRGGDTLFDRENDALVRTHSDGR